MAEDTGIFLVSRRIRGNFTEVQVIFGVGRLQEHNAILCIKLFFDRIECFFRKPLVNTDTGEYTEALRLDVDLSLLALVRADLLRFCIISAQEPFAVPAIL